MKGLVQASRSIKTVVSGTTFNYRFKLLNEPIDTTNPILLLPRFGFQIPLKHCAKLIPDSILRASRTLKRKEELQNSVSRGKKIEYLDGRVSSLDSRKNPKARVQLKAQCKKDQQISVRQIRWKGRLMAEILNIFHKEVSNPFLRLPVWRITRLEQSTDYQYCTIFWTIDHQDERQLYFSAISEALINSDSILRFHLSRAFQLKIIPNIRFLFENYYHDPNSSNPI